LIDPTKPDSDEQHCGNCIYFMWDDLAHHSGAWVPVCSGVEEGNEFPHGADGYAGRNCEGWSWDMRNE